jgi:hypothetical protein
LIIDVLVDVLIKRFQKDLSQAVQHLVVLRPVAVAASNFIDAILLWIFCIFHEQQITHGGGLSFRFGVQCLTSKNPIDRCPRFVRPCASGVRRERPQGLAYRQGTVRMNGAETGTARKWLSSGVVRAPEACIEWIEQTCPARLVT